jgi:hypothetical protein
MPKYASVCTNLVVTNGILASKYSKNSKEIQLGCPGSCMENTKSGWS